MSELTPLKALLHLVLTLALPIALAFLVARSVPGVHRMAWTMAAAAAVVGGVVITQRGETGGRPAEREDRRDVAAHFSGGRKRALVVGAGAVGHTLARHLELSGVYCVVGFADDDYASDDSAAWPVLGRRAETALLAEKFAVDEVFLAYAPSWQQQLVEDLASSARDVRLSVVPSLYETLLTTHRVGRAGDLALLSFRLGRGRSDAARRALDIGVALAGLALLSPVILAVAVLIQCTSRGPVIFSQERVGRFGRRFMVHKFRTMVHGAELRTGPVLSTGRDDERLTRVGRWLRAFRVDELPQLWNVLRGEMSLVGPRPERPCFVEAYERSIPAYARRHEVRPGITGLAQVCGGYHTDARDKLRFDLLYMTHRSVWLDVKILARTVAVVLASKGS